MEQFNAVTKQLDEVLKDLEWRKPDVEAEEAKLAELQAKAQNDPGVDVASQAIVVRVLRGVLDDKIAEADRLEKCMTEIQQQLQKLEVAAATPGEVTKSDKALRKKKKRLG